MATYNTGHLVETALRKRELGVKGNFEAKLTEKLSALTDSIDEAAAHLEEAASRAQACPGNEGKAHCHREAVIRPCRHCAPSAMRQSCLSPAISGPIPAMGEMLFSVM